MDVVLSATEKYYNYVAPTYGPVGKSVLIDEGYSLRAVDDGKIASQSFELDDECENAIIKYIRQAANKTDDRVGDGTTTAAVITTSLVKEILEHKDFSVAKSVPKEVASIQKGLLEAIKKIRKESKKVKTKNELYEVAFNSFNDKETATLVSETLFELGKDAFISVEDSQGTTMEKEVVSGLQIEKGFASPYLITSERGHCEIASPAVLLVNKKIDSFDSLVKLLTPMVNTGKKDIVVVADGFSDDVIRNTIVSKIQGLIRPLLVDIPGFGTGKAHVLKDICAIVGGRVVDPQGGDDIAASSVEWFGSAELVRSDRNITTFLNGGGSQKERQSRVSELQRDLEAAASPMEIERIKKRIAQLSGGVAIIRVGALTEHEQKTKRAKVDDAVNATTVAFRGGLSLGGGMTFSNIETSSETLNKALKLPRELLEKNGKEFLSDGVYDPTEVLIAALETAVSTASGLVMLSGVNAIKDKEEE